MDFKKGKNILAKANTLTTELLKMHSYHRMLLLKYLKLLEERDHIVTEEEIEYFDKQEKKFESVVNSIIEELDETIELYIN